LVILREGIVEVPSTPALEEARGLLHVKAKMLRRLSHTGLRRRDDRRDEPTTSSPSPRILLSIIVRAEQRLGDQPGTWSSIA